jgi:hypothetical protein
MVSPLFVPTNVKKDLADRAPDFVVPEDAVPIKPAQSKWNVAHLRRAARGYPCRKVAQIAITAAEGSFNPVVCDMSKPVVWPDRRLDPEDADRVRACLVKQVEKGQAVGPFPYCPFKNARPYPPGLAAKDKYDPECKDFRLISDLSAGGDCSVNSLTVNPNVLYVAFSVPMFCDECISAGVGTTFSSGDIPAAFKMNPQNLDLLHLFVTSVTTEKEKREFFVDICHAFGWTAAEYVFQCQLAIVKWEFIRRHIKRIFWYVDNFWQLHPPSLLGGLTSKEVTTAAAVAATMDTLSYLGIDIHKATAGFQGPVLGWQADLDYRGAEGPMVLILPIIKYEFYLKVFLSAVGMATLSLHDVRQACGIAQHVSTGLPTLKCFVAPLYRMTCNGEAKQARVQTQLKNFVPDSKVFLHVQPEARDALSLILEALKGWNRVSPMVMRFGPRSVAEVQIWVDAARGRSAMRAPVKSPAGLGALIMFNDRNGARVVRGFWRLFTEDENATARGPVEVSAPVLEMIAIFTALDHWLPLLRRKRVLLGTDCEPAMKAFNKGWSLIPTMRTLVRRTHLLVAPQHICLRVYNLSRERPPIAICDLLSRGQEAKAKALCEKVFGTKLLL